MKAFLSHSNYKEDDIYIKLLEIAFYCLGHELYVAERKENSEIDSYLIDKITRHIERADFLIVLYTKYADKSKLVEQEIGIAHGKKKKIFTILEPGTSPEGRLKEREQIRDFDREADPVKVIKLVINKIMVTLDIKKRDKKNTSENLEALKDLEKEILDIISKQDNPSIFEEDLKVELKNKFGSLTNQQYNLAINKLTRERFVVYGYDNDGGGVSVDLTNKGHKYLEQIIKREKK